jgi:hypothetical protein
MKASCTSGASELQLATPRRVFSKGTRGTPLMEEDIHTVFRGRLGIIPRRRVSQTLLRRTGANDTRNSVYIPTTRGVHSKPWIRSANTVGQPGNTGALHRGLDNMSTNYHRHTITNTSVVCLNK